MESVVTNPDVAPGLARSKGFLLPSTATTLPQIRRQGIRWSGGAGGHDLVIKLEFENPTPEPTRATSAIVQIARLGAFVPWHPLTAVRVPPIPPGRRRTVTAIVDPDDPKDLIVPGFGRRTDDRPRLREPRRGWLRNWLRSLFPNLGDVEACHFMGNLNVFVPGSEPVERHCSYIHLDPHADNIAVFFVGDGKRDAYTFSFESGQPGWDAEISNVAWDKPVTLAHGSLTLRLRAPANVESDHVTVWVTRASTGHRVPVEFALGIEAPDAAQCYQF